MRSLERKFGAICRAVAVKVAEGHRVTKTEASSPEDPTQQEGKSRSSVSVGTLDWRKGEVQMCEPPIRELRSVPQCTLTVLPLPATCSGNVG